MISISSIGDNSRIGRIGRNINNNRQRTWIRCLLFGLSLALFIISVSVTATLLFTPLYAWEINASGLEQASGLTRQQLMENYRVLIDYNTLWGPRELHFPNFSMSKTGAIHFTEVRRIFLALQIGIPVFGLLTAVGLWQARARSKQARRIARTTSAAQTRAPYRFLLIGGLIAICLPAMLGGLCALAWDQVFVTFHHLFFNNDYWIFDAETDPVIRVLPNQFFLHETALIFGLVVLGGVLSILAYWRTGVSK